MPNRDIKPPNEGAEMHEHVEKGVLGAARNLVKDSDWAKAYWSGAVEHGVPALGRLVALWLGGLVVVVLVGWAGWQIIELAIHLKGKP